nr:replication protein A 70 kDa DNA-binding subunit-like [Ipomoea batatas]
MPSQYVSVKEISPFHRKRSIRVRLIRMYEVPEVRGAQTSVPASLLYQKYSKVCVRIPPELEILSRMAMIFKIGFKKGTMRGPNSAYNVIRVLRDQLLLDTYCSNLRDHQDKDLMSKRIEDDQDEDSESDENETSQDDEVESLLPIDTGKRKVVDEEYSESVKKCRMDQFSTSKTTKKMKEVTVK